MNPICQQLWLRIIPFRVSEFPRQKRMVMNISLFTGYCVALRYEKEVSLPAYPFVFREFCDQRCYWNSMTMISILTPHQVSTRSPHLWWLQWDAKPLPSWKHLLRNRAEPLKIFHLVGYCSRSFRTWKMDWKGAWLRVSSEGVTLENWGKSRYPKPRNPHVIL